MLAIDQWYSTIVQPLLSAILGATVGSYASVRHLLIQRRTAWRERQLAEFYAPLAGIRKQIRAKSELRTKISEAAHAAWQDICRSYGTNVMEGHEAKFRPFQKLFDYDNAQLTAELIPKYREMLAIFTERYHLAKPETRAHYQEFLEFVEIWNRSLAGALPSQVLTILAHSEEKVRPFYDHLESTMQQLQDEIAKG